MPTQNHVLFINKSARSKTLSRSEGAERKQIFSHVQQLLLDDLESKSQQLSWHNSSTSTFHTDSRRKHGRGKPNEHERRRRHKEAGQETLQDPVIVLTERIARMVDHQSNSLCAVGSGSMDPFNCGAILLHAKTVELLQAYRHLVSTRLFTSKVWADNYLRNHLKYATGCPELLYATLYATSCEIYRRTLNRQHEYQTIYLKGQAIHHLHRSVETLNHSDNSSIAVMRAITFLLHIECAQGNFKAARCHYKALQNILETCKNVDQTPLAVRTGVIIPSLFCAAILSERPLNLPIFQGWQSEETSEFATELRAQRDLDIFTRHDVSRFSDPDNRTLIGVKLTRVLRKVYDLEQLKQSHLSHSGDLGAGEVRQLFGERLAIAQYLSAAPMQPDPFTAQQHAVKLALYLCYMPVRAAFEVTSIFDASLALQIRQALEGTDLVGEWGVCKELLMWVLAVTFSVFHDEDGTTWMVGHAERVRRSLKILTVEELEDVLSGFVYPRNQFGESIQRLWSRMRRLMPS